MGSRGSSFQEGHPEFKAGRSDTGGHRYHEQGGETPFPQSYREFDDAYSDVQVYSPYQVKELPKDYLIDATTIEAYSGKFNNVKEEFRKDRDDDDPDVNLVIDYDLRCYHMDQIDEDYILRLMEATRSDESAFIFESSGKNQKIIKEINEEILRFRKTNPARARYWMTYGMNIRISQKTL